MEIIRTYSRAIIKAAETLITKNLLITNLEIKTYVSGTLKIDLSNPEYYRKVAIKNLFLDNKGSYLELESYCNLLKELYIGSNVSLVMEGSNFHSIFVSLNPWIEIFLSSGKNNIALDATFLTGKNGGACFCCIFTDSDRNILPLGNSLVNI